MTYPLIHLPRETWAGYRLPMPDYTARDYYDVTVVPRDDGVQVTLQRQSTDTPVVFTPETYDYPDRLYAEHYPEACAWGLVEQGRLVGAIETCPERWSNRLRITELWVDAAWRRRGLGHALMAVAKEQARLERCRALILETQSCNVDAIAFYRREGFSLIGLDTCCYSNQDLARKEVRLELGLLRQPTPLSPSQVTLRPERPEDAAAAERMIQLAFWNRYHQGCDEHLLLHRMRQLPAYLPALSCLAWVGEELVGGIYYAVAQLQVDGQSRPVLGFGPLGVHPDWQGRGIGTMLLQHTLAQARAQGWPGVIIYGDPGYYSRVGFVPCQQLGITPADGQSIPAFQGLALQPDGLPGGIFHSPVEDIPLPAADVQAFHQRFPPLQPLYFPTQWPD